MTAARPAHAGSAPAPQTHAGPAHDRLGRPLEVLRVSLTDRCNFRCPYCMPAADFGPGHPFLPARALLSFDQLTRVVAAAVALGVRTVRLTGGEPLLRPGLSELVARLRALPGLGELALTTNGSLLAAQAGALRAAGLDRLTVSLDSLDPARFARLSGVGAELEAVLAGLTAARTAGFRALKVNCVVRQANLADVAALANHFRGTGITVRFIEYMDVGGAAGWSAAEVVPAATILDQLREIGPLDPQPDSPGQVAQRYRWRDGQGEVGLIASVSAPFCRGCTRLRLSADGKLYTCLFATEGLDLRPQLAPDAVPEGLAQALAAAWRERSDRYSELRAGGEALVSLTAHLPKVLMSVVGG